VVAEKAIDAWNEKRKFRAKKEAWSEAGKRAAEERWRKKQDANAMRSASEPHQDRMQSASEPHSNRNAIALQAQCDSDAISCGADAIEMQKETGTGTGTGIKDSSPPAPSSPPSAKAREGKADDGLWGLTLSEAGQRVCAAAGIDDGRMAVDFRALMLWHQAGLDLQADILPTIAAMAAKPSYKPPRSLRYFDRAIREFREERLSNPAASNGAHRNGAAPVLHEPPDAERNLWRARLMGFRDRKFWLPNYGPEPGKPRCEAPPDLIAEIIGTAPSHTGVNKPRQPADIPEFLDRRGEAAKQEGSTP
jgi:hypothetical protein